MRLSIAAPQVTLNLVSGVFLQDKFRLWPRKASALYTFGCTGRCCLNPDSLFCVLRTWACPAQGQRPLHSQQCALLLLQAIHHRPHFGYHYRTEAGPSGSTLHYMTLHTRKGDLCQGPLYLSYVPPIWYVMIGNVYSNCN